MFLIMATKHIAIPVYAWSKKYDNALNNVANIPKNKSRKPVTKLPVFFTDTLKQQFGDRIGEEGISIMTSEVGLDGNGGLSNGRIANWWNSLDDATKAEVSQFEKASESFFSSQMSRQV